MIENNKLQQVLRFLSKYLSNDIEANLKDYESIIDTLITLQEYWVQSKIETPLWKVSLDPLTTKAILHASSIKTLLSGTEIPNPNDKKNLKIIDIPSLYVLIRAQLENLLIIDYIYRNPKNEQESKFRHDCWMYSGLLARKGKTPTSESLKKQQEKDAERIEELKEKISSSNFFHKQFAKSDKRKYFLKFGHARLGKSWATLAKESNLNELIFTNLYPILSNHAHSEALGAINLQEKKLGYHKNHEEGFLLLFLSQIILSLVIKSFIKEFKILEIKYNVINSDIRMLIEQSASLGKKK